VVDLVVELIKWLFYLPPSLSN